MKKAYFIAFTFIGLVFVLIYTMDQTNKKIDNFFKLQKDINSIISINKDFDIFMSQSLTYQNFDFVQKDIEKMKHVLDRIRKQAYFDELKLKKQKKQYSKLEIKIKKKLKIIQKLKSTSAVLNNSYRYIQKLYANFEDNRFIKIYTSVLSMNIFNTKEQMHKITKSVNSLNNLTKQERVFLRHIEIILYYYNKFQNQKEEISQMRLNKKLEMFQKAYNKSSYFLIEDMKAFLWVIIIVLSITIILFLFYYSTMIYKKLQFKRFIQAVENSDNIIMTTDIDQKIKYVNDSFVKHTGYTFDEVVGKKPTFLKSGLKSKGFYEELNKTIYSGNKWFGEFINKRKDGELSYEKASITPIFNEKGEIVEFLSIKLDVSNERKIQEELKEKEQLLTQQSKMIAMHEMLDSIAHQWRQPLSTISTAASGMKLNKEFGTLDDKTFHELTDVIIDNTFTLSKTIDNFKTFFVSNHENRLFDVKESLEKVVNLIEYKFNENKIELVLNVKSFKLEGIEQEFIQSLVNILNNAQEAIIKNVKDNRRFIFVDIYEENSNILIKVKDNGYGIDEKIKKEIFEPYFTTKKKSQGTGIGLYMSYEVISKHFHGTIDVQNVEFVHNNIKFKGAEFTISIPKMKYE